MTIKEDCSNMNLIDVEARARFIIRTRLRSLRQRQRYRRAFRKLPKFFANEN